MSRLRTRRDADFVVVTLPGSVSAAIAINSTNSTTPSARKASSMGSCGYEIALSGGRMIRLPQDFDLGAVSQLIAVLDSC